jgi:hypothetical protein
MKISLLFLCLYCFVSCSSNSIYPTGTYKLESETKIRNGDTYGYFGEIRVKKLEDDKIALSLYVCRGAPSYNVGLVDDTLKMENNHSVLRCDMPEIDEKGELHFYFTKFGIEVKEKHLKFNEFCTFGHAVHADGFYKIKSDKIPKKRMLIHFD